MMAAMAGELLTFGPFVLDPAHGALRREGQPIALGQRGLALLQALLQADGGVVSKATLMQTGWPGSIVEEGNLTVQIAALRKVLGRKQDEQEWITTVPRVGYRLVPDVAEGDRVQQSIIGIPSLAVLPFQNLSSDPEREYFADGVVEDLITALSRFRSFAVISRHSSFAYRGQAIDVRQVARELGVRYVLEGSVRQSGARLRITAQLVEGTNGAHLWAQNFDGTLEDVFEFQDRITESVASVIEPMIARAEVERARRKPPASLGAYDLYLQALAIVLAPEQDSNARATELIERSLALDPHFAPALAVATNAFLGRFDRQLPGSSDTDRLRGLAYARAALAAAGNDANVRAVAGLGIMTLGDEYDSGMVLLRQAVAENPNSITVLGHAGIGAIHAGELDEAEQYFQRAIRFSLNDYSSHWLLGGMAHVRMVDGGYEEALDWARRSHAVNPHNHATHWMLIAANAHLGRLAEARHWREELQVLLPDTSLARIRHGQRMKDPRRIEVLIDGMRLAGLPEGEP